MATTSPLTAGSLWKLRDADGGVSKDYPDDVFRIDYVDSKVKNFRYSHYSGPTVIWQNKSWTDYKTDWHLVMIPLDGDPPTEVYVEI